MNELFFRTFYSKCKMHGSGDAQVVLSDGELDALLSISISDLGWDHKALNTEAVVAPSDDYYQIPLQWFDAQSSNNIRIYSPGRG